MALTPTQWAAAITRMRNNYDKAVGAGFRAGLLLAARASRERFIVTRSGPPLADRLTHRTGRLGKSIRHIEPTKRGNTWVGGTSANTPYARVHELGGSRHPPRPYLRPGLEEVGVPEIRKQMVVVLDTLARESFRGG